MISAFKAAAKMAVLLMAVPVENDPINGLILNPRSCCGNRPLEAIPCGFVFCYHSAGPSRPGEKQPFGYSPSDSAMGISLTKSGTADPPLRPCFGAASFY
jgi:hypothetical protein